MDCPAALDAFTCNNATCPSPDNATARPENAGKKCSNNGGDTVGSDQVPSDGVLLARRQRTSHTNT